MLDRLYPQQKLDILKLSRDVPTQVSNHIMALNTLRNTFAHRFHLADVPRSRRLYKSRYDVFTKKGLEKFNSDMWEIDEFFRPELTKLTLELVKHQREFIERFQS